MRNKLSVLCCFWGVLVGCAGAPADYTDDVDPIGPTVRERMKGRLSFDVAPAMPDGSGSFIAADVAGDLADEPQNVALPVVGGRVVARTDAVGAIELEELVIDLADVVLTDEQFPPKGLWLSGMHLHLGDPVYASSAWTADGEAAAVVAELDLMLDWGIVLSDGQVHPLATQTIRDVPFQLDIGRQGPTGLKISLGAHAEGVVWKWSSFVEVSNLGIDLLATY